MTPELAIYVLRRRAQNDAEARSHIAALEALGRAGAPVWIIEGDIMRPLTDAELASLEAARP